MNESLTNKQIAFILFGIIVGYGIVGLPKKIAETIGTSGWISIILSTVIAAIITNILIYLGYIHKKKTLFEYSEILTGKYIAYIIIIIYIFYYFLFFTSLIRVSSEIIKLTFLVKTPQELISISFCLIAFYAVINKLRVIGRLCELYGVVIIFAIFILCILIFVQGNSINLKPLFVSKNISLYFKSAIKLVFPFIGMEVIAFIPFDEKNNKNVFKYTTFMIFLIGILYILVAQSCIALVGVDDIIQYKDALFVSVRRVEIQNLEFLRRLDGIFIMSFIMSIICSITILSYGTTVFINKLFKNIQFNVIAAFVLFISFAVSQIPKSMSEIEKLIDFVTYLGIFPSTIIPIILLIITKVKKNAY